MKEGENQDIITLALNGIMYMGHSLACDKHYVHCLSLYCRKKEDKDAFTPNVNGLYRIRGITQDAYLITIIVCILLSKHIVTYF